MSTDTPVYADLVQFHRRAVEVYEAVETIATLDALGHAVGEQTRATVQGASAVMDDLFSHTDTPPALRKPKLLESES